MKTNYKTYADIEEIKKDELTCYKVTFMTSYDVCIFGKKIKTNTETEEVPFYFKSLEIAKDFCEIHPKYESTHIYNDEYYDRYVYYHTYKLTVGDENYYICWNYLVYKDVDDINFYETPNKEIVNTFVTKIELKDWGSTYGIYDITYINQALKLSDLIIKMKNYNTTVKKWRFQLVENDKN